MSMVLMPRDLRFCRWLNGWGGVTVALAAIWLGVGFSTAARRIRKLVDAGFLKRITVAGISEPVIVLTEEGRHVAGDPLIPLAGIRVSTWEHDRQMCGLEPRILRRFPNSVVHPERRIRSNRALAGVPAGHLPDAEVERAEGGPIALELELSQKAPRRIQAIVDGYATSHYAEVYYLVPDQDMARYVRRFTGGHEQLIRVQTVNLIPNNGDIGG